VTGVHCGRVLPEGFSAFLAQAAGARPYACWVHGEELNYIDSSRELRHLARMVFSRTRAVFANSGNTAALLLQRGVRSHLIHVIRPGVDTERFRPSIEGSDVLRRRLAGDAMLVCLSVGRLQRRKGHDLVLQAIAGLGSRREELRYVIVGDGEERARLEAMTHQLGLDAVVRFQGSVASDELPLYYAASDLFLLPNRVEARDFEGFGIVFLEAAASGVPVIAGRTGGVPEAVLDGHSGLLVSGEDAAELRHAMTILLENRDRRAAMGHCGRERVLREFTWQRAADQVGALHAQVFG
jgi:phosphatidylinositol alpha-1,6-mannosyltransferase